MGHYRQERIKQILEGNGLQKLFVSGSDYDSIQDGKYFYLFQNDDEEWELKIKDLVRKF